MRTPRQAHGEFGEGARLAVDADRAAMLLRDDVVADRQPEPGALPGRLCREEGLEQPVAAFRRDPGAVIADAYLDVVPEIARHHFQYRPVAGLAGLLRGSVKAVAEQVQEDAGDILRHDLDRRQLRVEIALHRDVEPLILSARAMKGAG